MPGRDPRRLSELAAVDAIRELSADEVARRCASPAFRGGAFYPDAATVQPARLALGLRDRLRVAGAADESSPVTRVADGSGAVEVRTPGGTIRADTAILAVGAAAKAPAWPAAQRPPPSPPPTSSSPSRCRTYEEIGWTGGECITTAAP